MARDPAEARRLAADPATDWATMYEVAQTNPEVRALLAANPSTYPDLLEWLGSLGAPEVDAALARRAAGAEPVPAPAAPETEEFAPPTQPEAPPAYAPTAAAAAARVPLTVERVPLTPGRVPLAERAGPPGGIGQPAAGDVPPLEPAAPAHRSRTGLVGALVALAVVVLIGVVWLAGRGDDAPTTATGTPTATPTSQATPTPTTAGPDLATESQRLLAAMAASSCADPATDAGALLGFAQVAAPVWGEEASQAARSAITALQARCNAGYAVAVADLAGGQSGEIAAALGGRDWVVAVRPAPAGATDVTSFASPSGNIACVLGEDAVTCSIEEYSFDAPGTCSPGAPVTVVVDGAGARPDCGLGAVPGGAPALAYGSAAVHSHFACTSDQSGVACWDTWTGAGFTIARAGLQTTAPQLGQ